MMIIRHAVKPSHGEIIQAWDAIEKANPGITREQLFTRVCNHFEYEIDFADIADALKEVGGDND